VAAEEVPGEVLAGISTELVQLHHRAFGRGPTRAQSFLREDTVICLLGGALTTPERTLVAEGNVDTVHRLRSDLRAAIEAPAKAIVERATGRRVIAYISQIRPDADLAVEVFVLEPSSAS
jgi:uncharacterized protein YbcI